METKQQQKQVKSTARLLAAAAATALVAASCTESYPGLEYVPDPAHVIKNTEDLSRSNTPIMVFATEQDFFTVGSRSAGAVTRGTGTFEDSTLNRPKYFNSTFNVFAFRAGTGDDGNGGQGDLTGAPDLTQSAYSTLKADKIDSDNTSCLLDGEDYWQGAEFKFNADQSGAFEAKDGKTRYYSGTYQDVGYNFFVYHIDDFKPTEANTHREADAVWYDFEVDGMRDLMFGSAPTLTSEVLDDTYASLHLTAKEKTNILKANGGYSTYSGHRNLHPIVKLSHKLCRLKFYAYPAEASASRTTIDSISVVSHYKGKLTVAGRTPEAVGVEWDESRSRELFLSEAAADTINAATGELNPYPGRLREGGYTVEWKDEYKGKTWAKSEMTPVGSSIMLPPAANYMLNIYSTYLREDGVPQKYTMHYTVFAPQVVRPDGTVTNIFDEGIVYNICIAVYGMQRIQIRVDGGQWIDGGTIVINPDEAEYD